MAMLAWQRELLRYARNLKTKGHGILDEIGASLEEILSYADEELVTKEDIEQYLQDAVGIAELARREARKIMRAR